MKTSTNNHEVLLNQTGFRSLLNQNCNPDKGFSNNQLPEDISGIVKKLLKSLSDIGIEIQPGELLRMANGTKYTLQFLFGSDNAEINPSMSILPTSFLYNDAASTLN